MAKFLYLYRGSDVPEELRDQNMQDWMGWIQNMQASGKLADMGAPIETGKIVSNDGSVSEFTWEGQNSGVGGWSIVQADSIDEAVELSKDCPQLNPQYGNGTVEVRPIIEMPGM